MNMNFTGLKFDFVESTGQSPDQGQSPKESGDSTARQSRRLTSGGTAVNKIEQP
jgi:hypothetical protein